MALEKLTDWKWKEKHVQPDDFGANGNENFITSESIVICAGPNTLPTDLTGTLIPIGLLEQAVVAQNRQTQELFEIGSRKSYFIPGRSYVQMTLARVMFNGPSLLKAVMAHGDPRGMAENIAGDPASPWPADPGDDTDLFTSGEWDEEYANYVINLASDFFNRPVGLGVLIHDSEDDKYGGFYLQNCYVQSHQFSVAGQQTVVMENCQIRASDMKPISYTE
tara:strand:+ start:3405 stop:4067 length:663 start_codon:yes stop_codon:yes gene_type:complete